MTTCKTVHKREWGMKDFDDWAELFSESSEFSEGTHFEFGCGQMVCPPYPPATEPTSPPCLRGEVTPQPSGGAESQEKPQRPYVPRVSVRRPDDLLILNLIFKGLDFKEEPPRLERTSRAAYIIAEFPPQSFGEEAYLQTAESEKLEPGKDENLEVTALIIVPSTLPTRQAAGDRRALGAEVVVERGAEATASGPEPPSKKGAGARPKKRSAAVVPSARVMK
jgi:hypothetical protein